MTAYRKKHWMQVIFIVVILAEICRDSSAGEQLGRLFTTPEERSILDSMRKQPKDGFVGTFSVQTRDMDTDERSGEALLINGLVYRANGRNTIWINNARILLDNGDNRQQPAAPGITGDVLSESPDYRQSIKLHNRDMRYTDD